MVPKSLWSCQFSKQEKHILKMLCLKKKFQLILSPVGFTTQLTLNFKNILALGKQTCLLTNRDELSSKKFWTLRVENLQPTDTNIGINFKNILAPSKFIYPKYSRHWLSTVAHTIDCVCSEIFNHGLNHGLSFLLFKFFG